MKGIYHTLDGRLIPVDNVSTPEEDPDLVVFTVACDNWNIPRGAWCRQLAKHVEIIPDEPVVEAVVETGNVIDLIISGIDNEIENLRDKTLVTESVVDLGRVNAAIVYLNEAKRQLLEGKK